MLYHRMARRFPLAVVVLIGLVPFLPKGGHAQESDTARAGSAEPVDEVVVTRRRNITSLINEGAKATEDFYSMLNVVLDNDKWRIDCRNEYPTNSRIPRRVCTTRFYENALNRQAMEAMRGFGSDEDGNPTFSGTIIDVQAEILAEQRLFEAAILEAVNTNPQLNAHVLKMMAIKQSIDSFETPRQERRRERRERRANGN